MHAVRLNNTNSCGGCHRRPAQNITPTQAHWHSAISTYFAGFIVFCRLSWDLKIWLQLPTVLFSNSWVCVATMRILLGIYYFDKYAYLCFRCPKTVIYSHPYFSCNLKSSIRLATSLGYWLDASHSKFLFRGRPSRLVIDVSRTFSVQ